MPLRVPPSLLTRHHVRTLSTRKHLLQQFPRHAAPPISIASSHNQKRASHSGYAEIAQVARFCVGSLIFCHIFNKYVYSVQLAQGPSMLPTIAVSGDYILTSKLHRRGRGIVVGDLVEVRSPWEQGKTILKRVMGMPGDFVEYEYTGDMVMEYESDDWNEGQDVEEDLLERDESFSEPADKRMIQVPEGHCWILGDNRPWSKDSRMYGPVPLALINGKVIARVLPLREMCWFENPLRHTQEKE